MSKHHFREGDTVRHKFNIDKKLIVNRILKESRDIIIGAKEDGTPIKKTTNIMNGIECHFWEYDKDIKENILRKEKFHSRELIPEFIVEEGVEAINKWFSE